MLWGLEQDVAYFRNIINTITISAGWITYELLSITEYKLHGKHCNVIITLHILGKIDSFLITLRLFLM